MLQFYQRLLLLGHIAVLRTYMWPIATDQVAWSVRLSVTVVSPAKTAELIEMPDRLEGLDAQGRTLHTAHPPYLSELITHYLPPRALRSSNTNLLARPTGITSNFTSRAFSVSAPSTWNTLPTHIRSLDKLSTFKRQLKSHLFQSAFAA